MPFSIIEYHENMSSCIRLIFINISGIFDFLHCFGKLGRGKQ